MTSNHQNPEDCSLAQATPVKAEIVSPAHAHGGPGLGWVGFSLIILAVLVFAAGLAAYLWLNTVSTPLGTPEAIASVQLEPKRWVAIREAYESPSNDLGPENTKRIEAMIERVFALDQRDDYEGIRRCIHRPGWLRQIERTDLLQIGFVDRWLIQTNFDEWTLGPYCKDDFEIVTIEQTSADEVIVYLYVWFDGYFETLEEQRWWFQKVDGGWKVTNWERIFGGVSEAAEQALTMFEGQPFALEYNEIFGDIGEAWHYCNKEQTRNFERYVRRLENRDIRGPLADYCRYLIAELHMHDEQWQAALDVFEQIRNPADTPGTYLNQARCFQGLGIYDRAQEMAVKYQDIVGFSPVATHIVATCHAKLGDLEQAKQHWVRLSERGQLRETEIQQLFRTLGSDAAFVLKPTIDVSSEPGEKLIDIVAQFCRPTESAYIEALVALLGDHDPASTSYLEGRAAAVEWNLELSAEKFIQAYREAGEQRTDLRELALKAHLSSMGHMQQLPEYYRRASDKRIALDQLIELSENEELDISGEDWRHIIADFRNVDGHDPRIDLLEAEAWNLEGEFAKALDSLTRGQMLASRNDDLALMAAYERAFRKTRLELDRPLEAYQKSSDSGLAFWHVGQFLVHQENWTVLEQLLDEHEANRLDSHAIYFSACLDESNGNIARAAQKLADMSRRKRVDELSFDMQEAVFRLQVKNGSWKQWIASVGGKTENSVYYDYLFSHLLDNRDYDGIDELLKQHAQTSLPASFRTLSQIRCAKERQDDETLESTLNSLPRAVVNGKYDYVSAECQISLFNLLWRNQRFDEAQPVAATLASDFFEALPALKLNIINKNTKAAEVALGEIAAYEYKQLIDDPQTRHYLTDPVFEDLRQQFPVSPSIVFLETLLDLMYVDQPVVQEGLHEKLLRSTGLNLNVALLKNTGQAGVKTWLAFNQDYLFVLTLRPGSWRIENNRCQEQTLPEHRFCLSIEMMHRDSRVYYDQFAHQPLAEKMAREFVDDNCVGLYVGREKMLHAPLSAVKSMDLQNDDPLNLNKLKRCEWTWTDRQKNESPSPWMTWRKVSAIIKNWSPEDLGKFEAQFSFELGSSREVHWFPIVGFDSKSDYSVRLHLKRTEHIQCMPALRIGELHSVSMFDVMNVRLATEK